MSNPLAGHTSATGFSGATGLRDGDGLTSPSLTNPYEALHGNGILRVADGGYGGTRNATGSGTEGHVAVGSSGGLTVSGGYAVLDGIVYLFAGGPGATTTATTIGTTNNHAGSLPSPHASVAKKAYCVIFVAADSGKANIKYEFGTLADTASETPQVPNTFLNLPGPDNRKTTVLAILLYEVSAGGALTASLNTPTVYDKRTFIRPSPLYLHHMTKGAAGNVTASNAFDDSADIDGIYSSPSAGGFGASPFGGMWQTHSPDGHSVLMYSAMRSIGGSPARATWRLAPNEVKVLTTSSNQSVTVTGPNIWIITTGGNITLNPTGTFPHGHTVEVYHAAGSHNLHFDSGTLNQNVAINKYAKFVYTGSAWAKLDLHTVS